MMSNVNITTNGIIIDNNDGTWSKLEAAKDIGDMLTGFNVPRDNTEIKEKLERNDNMDILELYKQRKFNEIQEAYRGFVDEDYNNLDVVKEYNELINTFEINLKQLADKYNTNDKTLLCKSGYKADYEYYLANNIKVQIHENYREQFNAEKKDLDDLVEEVGALLSLSDDKDYQIEVLKLYEILDKKGKLNI